MVKEIKAMGQCWAWADGRIEFGVEHPKGTLLLMCGDVQQMKVLIEKTAYPTYPASPDMADTWGVPGVADATGQKAAYMITQQYLLQVSKYKGLDKVIFLINPASSRAVRRETAQALNKEQH